MKVHFNRGGIFQCDGYNLLGFQEVCCKA